jgi:hypothetical protein
MGPRPSNESKSANKKQLLWLHLYNMRSCVIAKTRWWSGNDSLLPNTYSRCHCATHGNSKFKIMSLVATRYFVNSAQKNKSDGICNFDEERLRKKMDYLITFSRIPRPKIFGNKLLVIHKVVALCVFLIE